MNDEGGGNNEHDALTGARPQRVQRMKSENRRTVCSTSEPRTEVM